MPLRKKAVSFLITCLFLAGFPALLNAQESEPVEEEPAVEEQAAEPEDRELGAAEDPLEQQQAEVLEEPEAGEPAPKIFQVYGSARVRYRVSDDDSFWADGGSRIGLSARNEVKPDLWLFARGEAGINLLESADFLINRGASAAGGKFTDNLFTRLLYIGIETPDYMVTAGKNWSTYYRVTSFTDRFQGTGGSASGTYNAGTDGGWTGTGRADRVLQSRIQINPLRKEALLKPFKLNLQVQNGESIPGIEGFNYKTTIGLSALFAAKSNFSAGLAYNHANIDKNDLDNLRAYGIDGDATALSLGLRWFSDDWYLASVISRLDNHEATNELTYFDGTGVELYAQYRLHNKWWVVAGGNYLSPDSDQTQAGDFNVNYGVLGLRYSFRELQQMIFANARLSSGSSQDGTPVGDYFTVGVRWDFP